MKTLFVAVACILVGAVPVWCQQTPVQDPLLDKLTGDWLLQGTIAGKQTTHDISAEWVLNHQYVRIHEVSREKNSHGQPAYEAMVFTGWDQPTADYVCAWIDTFGGMGPATLGRGKREGDEIHFIFKDKDKNYVFHTRFIYHKETGKWEWRLDSEEKAGLKPFARVVLTHK